MFVIIIISPSLEGVVVNFSAYSNGGGEVGVTTNRRSRVMNYGCQFFLRWPTWRTWDGGHFH